MQIAVLGAHPLRDLREQVVEHGRLQREVKVDGLVEDLRVGHLRQDLLELGGLPGFARVRDHAGDGVVKLVVVHVQEHDAPPLRALLARLEHLADVEP